MTIPAIGGGMPRSLQVDPRLLALRPRAVLRALQQQPISVWAALAYLFFEYVRPASIYRWMEILPWSWIALVTAFVAMLAESIGQRRWTFVDGALLAYTLVLLASVVTAFIPAVGVAGLKLYFSWVMVFLVISTTINTETRIILMLLTWFLWNLKMTQHGMRSWATNGFGFTKIGVVGGPGWFHNSGEFGIQTCVFLPISLYFSLGIRRFVTKRVFLLSLLLPVSAFTSALATSSRGAQLGLAAIGLWIVFRSKYKLRSLIAMIIVVLLALVLLPPEQKARFSSMGDDPTSQSRLTYWERGLEFASEHPWLGIGYDNWIPYYSYVWGGRLEPGQRIELPHNIFIEAVSEMGYLGLTALILLIIGSFLLTARTRRVARSLGERGVLLEHLGWGFDGALIGFMVTGSFVTVLYYPYLWVNLGMVTALYLTTMRTARALRRAARQSRQPAMVPLSDPASHLSLGQR